MTAGRERSLALLLVAGGVVLLALSLPMTWVTVPASLTMRPGPVSLSGLIVFEDGLLHALLVGALLLGLWRWDDWRRTTVAVTIVLVSLVWLGQALERAAEAGNAAARADEGPQRLGLNWLEDRGLLARLALADLPVTPWPWVAVGGSLVTASGAVLVLVRSRRWEAAAPAGDGWWAA
ncbi:MAG: Trp biosynthesis-associated membrane protein [Mycobacteriales bacterium]|nr:Trp biosynthesis-associated membrane protein [Mycobacteriales bacterium]